MNLQVGMCVVYPVHGVATVTREEIRIVDGEPVAYVALTIAGQIRTDTLTILVRRDRLEELGVRYAMSQEDAADVLDVLAIRTARLSPNWSRRFKNHQSKLKSGDVFECAEVVRNLALRQKTKSLAWAEKSMYRQARRGLIAELAVTWGVPEDAAADRVDRALR